DLHGFEAMVAGPGALRDQVAGQTTVRALVAQQSQLTIEEISDVRDACLQGVHNLAHVTSIEVAAVQSLACLRVEQWIVIAAIEFYFDGVAARHQVVQKNAYDVGSAANRITILKPSGTRFRTATKFQVVPDPGGAGALARVRFEGEQPIVEVSWLSTH